METCPDLTMLQRAAGLVTWTHLLQLAGIVLAVSGLLIFCSGLVRKFLQQVRAIEALLWTLCVAAAAGTFVVPAAWQPWLAMAACLILPGAGALSVKLRQIRLSPARVAQILAVAWGAMALLSQQPAVGFLAVAAFISVLGLSIVVAPFCYGFGFRDEEALVRAPAAGALMALSFAAVVAAGWALGPLAVFRAGALWLGSFTWFLGLLILSNGFWRRGSYLRAQLVTIASLALALTLGLWFAVGELTTMAGAFWLFYLAAKIIEMPVHGRIALGAKLLAAGGMVTLAWLGAVRYLPVLA